MSSFQTLLKSSTRRSKVNRPGGFGVSLTSWNSVAKFTSAVTKSVWGGGGGGGILGSMFLGAYCSLKVPPCQFSCLSSSVTLSQTLTDWFSVKLRSLIFHQQKKKKQCSSVTWKQQMTVQSPTFITTVMHLNTMWLVIPGTFTTTVNHNLYIICV